MVSIAEVKEQLASLDQQVEILIGGIPASFKTSVATHLASQLGLSMIGTDQLRALARVYDDNPFLQGTTHTRWQLLGGSDYLVEGFLKQGEVMQPIIEAARDYHRARGEHCVIEGVHVVPGLTSPPKVGIQLLMVIDDPHLQQARMHHKFSRDPEEAVLWTDEKTQQLQVIEQELVSRASAIARDSYQINAQQELNNCQQQALTVLVDNLTSRGVLN